MRETGVGHVGRAGDRRLCRAVFDEVRLAVKEAPRVAANLDLRVAVRVDAAQPLHHPLGLGRGHSSEAHRVALSFKPRLVMLRSQRRGESPGRQSPDVIARTDSASGSAPSRRRTRGAVSNSSARSAKPAGLMYAVAIAIGGGRDLVLAQQAEEFVDPIGNRRSRLASREWLVAKSGSWVMPCPSTSR